MGKNRRGKSKKKSGRDEDSNVNADIIPEDAREIVQNLQEILTLHSEQDIYAMLLECKMNPNEAITRLLSQDSFQEVKSKRSKKKEAMEKKALMGLNADNIPEIMREEESSLNADNVPENSIEIVQKLKEVVNCSEQESYNMNPDEAVNSLLSQDSIQQVESKQDEKKETKDTSDCQGVGSNDQNHEFTNGGDSYVGQCGGNKFNSDGICNLVAGSSTTLGILGPLPLNSFKKNREERVRKIDEDSNADNIPEDASKMVQELKEISTLHSKQEMDPQEAITHLLSQDSLQEVKSKQDKKKEEKKSSKRDEESSVNSDNIPADSREVVQKLKEVVNYSEQRSYKEVVKCNMNPDEAVNRLLSQDRLEQVKSKEDKNKETKDTSDCQGVGSSESSDQNHEFTIGSDSYVGLGGGNKFNSDETSNVQELCNHLDDSSITFGTLGPPSLNSDLTKRVPISSSEAVPSLSVPSSGLISVWGCGTSGQKTMDDVVKMSVDIAPVKDDCPLPEKRDVPISFIESPPLNQLRESARVKQLLESALVYNQNFQDGGSRLLCDKYNNKNGETYQVPKFSYEHNQSELRAMLLMFLQRLKRNIANDQRAHQMNSNAASNYHSSSNYDQREPTQGNQNKSSSATDFTFDNSQLFNPVMAPSEPSLQRQNFITFLNSMHPQYLASHLHLSMPTISSLGRRLPLSITEALMASNSESQMNRQAMTQQAYTREPDPQYLASPLNQSMPTEPSLGRRLPLSITEEMASISEQKMNGQAMNQQAYTMEPGPQYSAPPLHPSMDSISEPQMNGQAMNQQPYVRKTDPQYLAPPLHLPVASINEPQMNGQAMNQQAYTREQDPQYSASPLNHSMLSASSHGRRPSASEIEALVLSSINKPQVNGQAMNQQAYTREPNPQYSASPLNQSMPTASSLDRRPSASDIKALVPTSINKRQMKQQMKRQAMNQQAYTSERDPQYSASPLNQSMPTAASHGRRPSASEIDALAMASISKPQMNGQATNHHYSQPTVPSGHYGTMMNYPNSQSTQNDTYNMSPSAIQQHGGNNNAYHLQPLVALLPQHINTDLSPSAVPFVPSAHRSTNGSTYNSAYGFGMLSDNNAANSRFGSDNVFSSLLNNQLPSFQHQNGNSNVWAPQGQNNSGSNYYGLFVGHQNQQSPSLRHSPQQEEQRYYESIHQESNRRDPSNQTQQQPRPSNNY